MCIAGNSVANIKSKFRQQILLDGIVKHFRPGFADQRNFVFFQSWTESKKKHKLAYFIQLIAGRYKAYIRQKSETVKKKFSSSVSTGLRPVLLQDYVGTILGTISSTTNSTKIVPETSEKNCVFGGGFLRYNSWYYLWYYFFDVIMPCDQDKTGTGLRFLVDARRSCRPCHLSPLASAAAIVTVFSTAAFS
jgi:hypothetical protein